MQAKGGLLHKLPPEILSHVISKLSPWDIVSMQLACGRLATPPVPELDSIARLVNIQRCSNDYVLRRQDSKRCLFHLLHALLSLSQMAVDARVRRLNGSQDYQPDVSKTKVLAHDHFYLHVRQEIRAGSGSTAFYRLSPQLDETHEIHYKKLTQMAIFRLVHAALLDIARVQYPPSRTCHGDFIWQVVQLMDKADKFLPNNLRFRWTDRLGQMGLNMFNLRRVLDKVDSCR